MASTTAGTAHDAELVRRTLDGDRRAFGELVRRHQDAVFGLVSRLVGARSDVEDIAQDAFLRAYRALPTFRGDAQFGTWLYRIAWNTCLDRREQQAHRQEHEVSLGPEDDEDDPHEPADPDAPLPDEVLEADDVRERLAHHLGQLPDHYRAVLTLYYYGQQSYDEIARVLDIPMNTVKVHIHRAKAQLRKALVAERAVEGWTS